MDVKWTEPLVVSKEQGVNRGEPYTTRRAPLGDAEWAGAVNHGSNLCLGAKFPHPAPSRRSPFLFCNFPGSNGAVFRTVRTGSSATPRPARWPFRIPHGGADAAPRRVAAKIVQTPGS